MTQIIELAAHLVGVPSALLLAICGVESDLRNVIVTQDPLTPSYGVCQVKLGTARFVAGPLVMSYDLMDPHMNSVMAAKYLKWQLKRYNGSVTCAISAYNAGTCNRDLNYKYVMKVIDRMAL